MPEPLTALERRIYDYLVEYVRANTYQPSIREIGRRFDIKSTKTVAEHLQALADKGWVERDPSRSRGVRLLGVDLGASARRLPLYGGIAPDGEALRAEAVLGELVMDAGLAGDGESAFLLTMRGRSMEGAGIFDGDVLLVHRDAQVTDGDVVLARAAGEVVIARLHRQAGVIRLAPAAPGFPAHALPSADVEVIGRVAGAWRQLAAAAPGSRLAAAGAAGGNGA